MSRIKVALVNDYEIVVLGLRSMLRRYEDRIEFVELSAGEAVGASADIALYDSFANPDTDHKKVRALAENPQVRKAVLYSWTPREDHDTGAMSRGISGFISKSTPANKLVEALETIHAGNDVAQGGTAKAHANYGDWPGREEGLTQREAEILALITQGISNEDIAGHTNLSINSVKTYIRSCYRKIGVSRRPQAVLWGVHNGFLPDRTQFSLALDR